MLAVPESERGGDWPSRVMQVKVPPRDGAHHLLLKQILSNWNQIIIVQEVTVSLCKVFLNAAQI